MGELTARGARRHTATGCKSRWLGDGHEKGAGAGEFGAMRDDGRGDRCSRPGAQGQGFVGHGAHRDAVSCGHGGLTFKIDVLASAAWQM